MKVDVIFANSDLGVSVNGTELVGSTLNDDVKKISGINNIYHINKPSVQKETDDSNLRKNIDGINEFNHKLYDTVLDVLHKGHFPFVIGGDHSIAIASVLASKKCNNDLSVFWVDAHADFNSFETTKTGNLHGLPFATVTGHSGKDLAPFYDGEFVDSKNCIHLGIRDFYPEQEERELFESSGLTYYPTDALKVDKIPCIVKEAFDKVLKHTESVHISFDLDLIDPNELHGVSVPSINGISLKEAYCLLNELLKYKKYIKSFDLVEYNVLFDDDNSKEHALYFINQIITAFND